MKVKCFECAIYRNVKVGNERPESYAKRRPLCIKCGKKKAHQTLGERGANWQGGRIIDCRGYARVWVNSGYQREHRFVWEKHNGKIPNGFIIHHKDRDKLNNHISNLECMEKKEHDKMSPMIKYGADILWGNITVQEARKLQAKEKSL